MVLQIFPEPGVDPRLIAANSILQLSTLELEQAVARELDENPALEMVERLICPTCGGMLRFGICASCSGFEFTAANPSLHPGEASSPESGGSAQENTDPFGVIPAPLTLAEHLFAQLRLLLPERDHGIALYLVGNLDEHGYLTLPVEEVARNLRVETERVYTVLGELQGLEPAGVGARDLTECLLIQLERLAKEGIAAPQTTEMIIQHHLTELGHHQFEHIRTALGSTRAEIEEAFLFIRTNLHPYPAHHHYAHQGPAPQARASLVPSVLIHRNASSAGGYEVEVIESQRFLLRVNPTYQQIRQQPEMALSTGELEHVTHFLERARLFMSQLQRRSVLLRKVMTYLVSYQHDFLDQGLLHLRPLTQKTVAQALDIHVSTISRAIAAKFAWLPSQELIPLHRFFSAELRVQELIRQIIAGESDPLSDARVAELLKERHSITLSRQMVANYRTELGIPAARQRAVLHHNQREAK